MKIIQNIGHSKLAIAAFVAIATISTIACSANSQNANQTVKKAPQIILPQEVQPMNPKIVEANTTFGFKLFSEILKKDGKRNVFVSPSSVAIALAMTYNGASGETKTAMAKALELQGMTLEEINQAHQELKADLEKTDPRVQLSIANSLWARKGVSFNPSFIQRNEKFYDAKVESLDFSQPAAVEEINGWVKESTDGKIEKMVDRIDPDNIMFLMNALYFKGKWTTQFDKSETKTQPFSLANGAKKQSSFMSRQGEYRYMETRQFQAISLPYGDERLSMYVFLPKSNLAEFQKTLTAENWRTWMKKFSTRQGQIQLPRFKMDYDVKLKTALSALGMKVAFEDAADFSGLSTAATKIDQVTQKTFVEVTEEGTEAAAVTSVGIMPTSIRPEAEPFKMTVDRPFFCAIRDHLTGEILFMGSIVNPNSN